MSPHFGIKMVEISNINSKDSSEDYSRIDKNKLGSVPEKDRAINR